MTGERDWVVTTPAIVAICVAGIAVLCLGTYAIICPWVGFFSTPPEKTDGARAVGVVLVTFGAFLVYFAATLKWPRLYF